MVRHGLCVDDGVGLVVGVVLNPTAGLVLTAGLVGGLVGGLVPFDRLILEWKGRGHQHHSSLLGVLILTRLISRKGLTSHFSRTLMNPRNVDLR